jgi:hypothetical protein
MAPRDELRQYIDFDKEKGREPRRLPDGSIKPNGTYVRIKYVGQINMAVIRAYLEKKIGFDNSVLEAISKYFATNSSIP